MDLRSPGRAASAALIVVLAALGAMPFAAAEYECEWRISLVSFRCIGERGCAPGFGVTPGGVAFIGCLAWD